MDYIEFFEKLGKDKTEIWIDGNKMEVPVKLLADGEEGRRILDKAEMEGKTIQIPVPGAIIAQGVSLPEDPAPDIAVKIGVDGYAMAWIISGKPLSIARTNITKRLEAATGCKVVSSNLLPLFGYNGVALEVLQIQNRAVVDYDKILPVIEKDLSGLLPKVVTRQEEKKQKTGTSSDIWDEVRRRGPEVMDAMYQEAKEKVNGVKSWICPICGHGAGGDGLAFIPIGKKYRDTKTGDEVTSNGTSAHCFGCGFTGSIIDMISIEKMISAKEAMHMAADAIGIDWRKEDEHLRQTTKKGSNPPGNASEDKTPAEEVKAENGSNYIEYYQRCQERLEDPAAVEYLQGRGYSIETVRAAGIGYDPAADPANCPGAGDDVKKPHPEQRIIVPCSSSSYIGRAIRPDIDKKWRKVNAAGASVSLFQEDNLHNGAKTVFIVEGWADAIAVMEVGAAAVSLNGTSNTGLLLSNIRQNGTSATLVLCLDNDNAGSGALKTLENDLPALGVRYVIADICHGSKDPAEALQTDRDLFLSAVNTALEAAEKERNRDTLTDFWDRIQGKAYKPQVTGLTWFDELLDGGLLPQTLTILMATPGSGKTALCQQIAECMAEHKSPVIYVNLEMSTEQMLSRAISMKTAQSAEHKEECMTALEVLQGYKWTQQQRKIALNAMDIYRRNNFSFIRYEESTSDIDKISKYLNETGKAYKKEGRPAPAVILDYLHLVTAFGKTDAAEIVKQTVTVLKQYAINYNTVAVAISAIARASYSRITLSSGRDSSGIEYTGDNILSLDYTEIDEKGSVDNEDLARLQQVPLREMRVRVLKSRHCVPGRKRDLLYDAAHNIFFDRYKERTGYVNEIEPATPFHETQQRPVIL